MPPPMISPQWRVEDSMRHSRKRGARRRSAIGARDGESEPVTAERIFERDRHDGVLARSQSRRTQTPSLARRRLAESWSCGDPQTLVRQVSEHRSSVLTRGCDDIGGHTEPVLSDRTTTTRAGANFDNEAVASQRTDWSSSASASKTASTRGWRARNRGSERQTSRSGVMTKRSLSAC